MSEPKISKEDFELQYLHNCPRQFSTLEELRRYMTIRPCDCDYEHCQGWQMLSHENADEYDREHHGGDHG